MVKPRIDMTGWVMAEHGVPDSRLTVVKQVDDYVKPNGQRQAQWLCICSCGKENIISIGYSLRNGHIKSCGCLLSDKTIERNRKPNKYDLSGDYGIGWTSNTNREFYFDLEDYDKIKDYCWYETFYNNKTDSRLTTKGSINFMHMVFGKYGDHINRNPFDNRKSNLRQATASENSMNRGLQSNNTSGITGVCWDKRREKWMAYIKINHKNIYLGTFDDKDDAIKARLNGEVKYMSEFAPQKHLFEQYNIITHSDCNEEVVKEKNNGIEL